MSADEVQGVPEVPAHELAPGVNGTPRGRQIFTAKCPLDEDYLPSDNGGQRLPYNSNHCWRCHYEASRVHSEQDNEGDWDRTATLIWASFCNQWLIVGWMMLVGRE